MIRRKLPCPVVGGRSRLFTYINMGTVPVLFPDLLNPWPRLSTFIKLREDDRGFVPLSLFDRLAAV